MKRIAVAVFVVHLGFSDIELAAASAFDAFARLGLR